MSNRWNVYSTPTEKWLVNLVLATSPGGLNSKYNTSANGNMGAAVIVGQMSRAGSGSTKRVHSFENRNKSNQYVRFPY